MPHAGICGGGARKVHSYSDKTQGDSRGLQGNGKRQQVPINLLPLFDLTTKVARRRHFSKTRDAGSIPAASTMRGLFPQGTVPTRR